MIPDKKILILDNKKIAPFTKGFRFLKFFIKEGLIKRQWSYIFRNYSVGGSVEIPRNLLQELKKRNFRFDFNTYIKTNQYDVVVVIKNRDALEWALNQKKLGLIKKLIVGPFISTLPSDNHFILETPLIDRLIFLCEWHRKIFYSLYTQQQIPGSIWYAGVDTERWKPSGTSPDAHVKHILIYKKYHHPELTDKIESYFQIQKISYKVIQNGFYSSADYKHLLENASMTVFVSHSETQGLAIFESWSMNVPTMHWDPEYMNYYGVPYPHSSSAPYLTDELGLKYKDYTSFEKQFENFYIQCQKLNPRKIMIEKYSSKISAELFETIIQNTI